MKIAIVAPYFGVRGGREQTVYELARGLAERGHFVKVFTTDRTPSGERIKQNVQKNEKFEVERIKSAFVAFRVEIPLKFPKLSHFDIVHVISTDDIFTFIFAIAAKISKKPVVATVFTPLALLKHPKWVLRPLMAFIEFISLVSIAISDLVHVKNEVDSLLMRKIKNNVVVIPDGIPRYYFNLKPAVDFRRKYGLVEKKIILFVNRIHPLKGPQLLVEAMPEILKEYPDAFAVFIGPDAGYADELKRLASERKVEDAVLFLGFVSEEEKIAAYDAADVVVIPSIGEFTEAFSIVLSEAWARRKTVVVSESRALRSRAKGYGYIFKGYNAKNLADSVKKALIKPKKPAKVHTWDEVVEMMERVYFAETEGC
ncbi:MAG: glycosyltransferase family 4 protein [Canidatus Methanoxibalbensis ujae]|nr:glycosyltransferase family 4 protein [Candidatus Methanoxibalbensis ujae]